MLCNHIYSQVDRLNHRANKDLWRGAAGPLGPTCPQTHAVTSLWGPCVLTGTNKSAGGRGQAQGAEVLHLPDELTLCPCPPGAPRMSRAPRDTCVGSWDPWLCSGPRPLAHPHPRRPCLCLASLALDFSTGPGAAQLLQPHPAPSGVPHGCMDASSSPCPPPPAPPATLRGGRAVRSRHRQLALFNYRQN